MISASERSRPHSHDHSDPRDTVGQVLSAVCAVHCVSTPFVLMAIPAAASFLGGFHPVLVVLVLGVAVWAFVPGYRQHRRKEVLLEAGVGIGLLAVAAIVFQHDFVKDTALSLAGASVMMLAHWRNRVLQRRCCSVQLPESR